MKSGKLFLCIWAYWVYVRRDSNLYYYYYFALHPSHLKHSANSIGWLLQMTNKCIIYCTVIIYTMYIIHTSNWLPCDTNTNTTKYAQNLILFYSPFRKRLYSRKLNLKGIFNILLHYTCIVHITQITTLNARVHEYGNIIWNHG